MAALFILRTVVGCGSSAPGLELHTSLLTAIFMRNSRVVVSIKTQCLADR